MLLNKTEEIAVNELHQSIKANFNNRLQKRGQEYYSKRQVKNAEISKIKPGYYQTTAIVLSDSGTQYSTKINFSAHINNKINTLNASTCNCPMGKEKEDCKHVVALIYETINLLKTGHLLEQPETVQTEDLADIEKALQTILKDRTSYETQYLVSEILGSSFPKKKAERKSDIFFCLNLTASYYSDLKNLSIFPVLQNYNKNGSISRARPTTLISRDGLQVDHIPEGYLPLLARISKVVDSYSTHYKTATLTHNVPIDNLIKEIIDTGKCVKSDFYDEIVSWGQPRKGNLQFDLDKDKVKISLELDGEEPYEILRTTPIMYYNQPDNHVGLVECDIDSKIVLPLLNRPVSAKELSKIAPIIKQLSNGKVNLQDATKITEIQGKNPIVKIDISYKNSSGIGVYEFLMNFMYNDQKVPFTTKFEPYKYSKNSKLFLLNRDVKIEDQAIRQLKKLLPYHWYSTTKGVTYEHLGDGENIEFHDHVMSTIINTMIKNGWDVKVDDSCPYKTIENDFEFFTSFEDNSSGYDWFEFDTGVKIDGQEVSLIPAFSQFLKKNNIDAFIRETFTQDDVIPIVMNKNEIIRIPALFLQSLAANLIDLFKTSLTDENKLKIDRWRILDATEVAAMVNATEQRWIGSDKLKHMAERLSQPKLMEDVTIPSDLNAELRPYQKEGLNWLQFMSNNNFGGILADDMGLGKTVQTISHILKEKEKGQLSGPNLIIAPTSLMGNWENELKKFAPNLTSLTLHGADRKKNYDQIDKVDIVLTTYPLVVRDGSELLKHKFYFLILDEAQQIKNPLTKYYLTIQQLKAEQRLCLTGTPMENHLGELWSIFNFLMPGFLGTQKAFTQMYRRPIEKFGEEGAKKHLARRISPFILRRTKSAVVKELPPKTEIIQTIHMENDQRSVYEAIRIAMNDKINQEISKKGFNRSQIIILDALLKMRQACCDPRLLKGDLSKKASSAKMAFLKETLPEMVEEGRQILIFSQFAEMIKILETELNTLKIPYSVITGQTKDRKTPVTDFQSGKTKIFLITLKAGGTGLNLTAADTVIHVDPWWNPAAENQATDRAYRIGQDKPVFVYKLITSGSIEEKILTMQQAKAQLMAGILDGDAAELKAFSQEEIKSLFAPISVEN